MFSSNYDQAYRHLYFLFHFFNKHMMNIFYMQTFKKKLWQILFQRNYLKGLPYSSLSEILDSGWKPNRVHVRVNSNNN